MSRPVKLIIQIPCWNEEATLPETLADLPREVPGVDVVEWLVIDDGSDDRTVEVARENGVDHVVSHARNKGLAAAFMTGLDACLAAGADVIVNTDADNQYRGDSIVDLVAPVVTGRADVVVGERPIDSIDDFSRSKKFLQRLGSRIVRRFSGTGVKDAASGFRAYNRDAALQVQVFGRYSYTMETIIQAGWNRLAVESVPIEVNPKTRDSKLVRSVPQYLWRSGQAIVRSFALYKPFRFFFFLGCVPLLIGMLLVLRWLLLYAIEDEYQSRVPSLLTGFGFLVVAVQIWGIAFLADLQAANRRVLEDLRVAARRREFDANSSDSSPDD
ncbi:glycosyltransferase family 2 protein [Ilumatobacter nonamiensis]|uniref:glycosyltransferase family 2 protein n=1 Tax=Ilumatobacter nonamiensis TaxID=467093 RepID=UPI000345B2EE|nr:glycosyltransferase family 2 protein [Ilumatobacter nonamiensis]